MGTGMKLIKASEQAVRHWFGERGYPLGSQPIKFRVVESDDCLWLFLYDSKSWEDEVTAYQMDNMWCEPYTNWPRKDFDWSKENLEKLVQQMED